MADVFETYLRLYGTSSMQTGLAQVARAYGQAGQEQTRFEQGMGRASAGGLLLGGAMTAMGLGIAVSLKGAVEAAGQFESRVKSFNIVFKQGEGFSRAYLRSLQDFALQTTEGSDRLEAMASRMKAVGFETKNIIPTLRVMLDAVAGAGGGQTRLERVLLAITHIQEQGRLVQRSVNMLEMAGVLSADQLAKRLGITKLQMADIGRQHILTARALPAILAQMKENFGGGMQAQLDTYQGKLHQIHEAWEQIKIDVGEPILNLAVLPALRTAYGLVKGIRDLVHGMPGLGLGLGAASLALTAGGVWQLGRTGALALRGLEGAAGVGPGLMSVLAARMFGFGPAAAAGAGGGGLAGAAGMAGATAGGIYMGRLGAATFGQGIPEAAVATGGRMGLVAMAARIALPVAAMAAGIGLLYSSRQQTSMGEARAQAGLGGALAVGVPGALLGLLLGGPIGAGILGTAFAALGGTLGGVFAKPGPSAEKPEDMLRKIAEAAQKTAENTSRLVDKGEYYRAEMVGGEDVRRPFPEAKLNAILHAMS